MQTTEMLYTNSKRNELVYNIISGAYNFDLDTLAEYNIKFPYTYTTIILLYIDALNLMLLANRRNISIIPNSSININCRANELIISER